jgi:uncharacterized membrane protein YphA (DoxX/SURF4 family)
MNADPISLVLAAYMLTSALHHIFNGKALQKYALHHDVLGADRSVKMSALIFLIMTVLFLLPEFAAYAGYTLSAYFVLMAFAVHRFWYESNPVLRMSELLHFIKNFFFGGVVLVHFLKL